MPKSVFFKRKELPLCVLMENKQPVERAAMPKKWQTAHTKGKFERAWISSALFEVVVCVFFVTLGSRCCVSQANCSNGKVQSGFMWGDYDARMIDWGYARETLQTVNSCTQI